MQNQSKHNITFDTQLKTALNDRQLCHHDRFLGQYLLPTYISTARKIITATLTRSIFAIKCPTVNNVTKKSKWAYTADRETQRTKGDHRKHASSFGPKYISSS